MRESFWQKGSLIIHIFFELWQIMIFSPVANFGQHPLLFSISVSVLAVLAVMALLDVLAVLAVLNLIAVFLYLLYLLCWLYGLK